MEERVRKLYEGAKDRGKFARLLGPEDERLMGLRYLAAVDTINAINAGHNLSAYSLSDIGAGAGDLYPYLLQRSNTKVITKYIAIEPVSHLFMCLNESIKAPLDPLNISIEDAKKGAYTVDIAVCLGVLATTKREHVYNLFAKALSWGTKGFVVSFPLAGVYKGAFNGWAVNDLTTLITVLGAKVNTTYLNLVGDYATLGVSLEA